MDRTQQSFLERFETIVRVPHLYRYVQDTDDWSDEDREARREFAENARSAIDRAKGYFPVCIALELHKAERASESVFSQDVGRSFSGVTTFMDGTRGRVRALRAPARQDEDQDTRGQPRRIEVGTAGNTRRLNLLLAVADAGQADLTPGQVNELKTRMNGLVLLRGFDEAATRKFAERYAAARDAVGRCFTSLNAAGAAGPRTVFRDRRDIAGLTDGSLSAADARAEIQLLEARIAGWNDRVIQQLGVAPAQRDSRQTSAEEAPQRLEFSTPIREGSPASGQIRIDEGPEPDLDSPEPDIRSQVEESPVYLDDDFQPRSNDSEVSQGIALADSQITTEDEEVDNRSVPGRAGGEFADPSESQGRASRDHSNESSASRLGGGGLQPALQPRPISISSDSSTHLTDSSSEPDPHRPAVGRSNPPASRHVSEEIIIPDSQEVDGSSETSEWQHRQPPASGENLHEPDESRSASRQAGSSDGGEIDLDAGPPRSPATEAYWRNIFEAAQSAARDRDSNVGTADPAHERSPNAVVPTVGSNASTLSWDPDGTTQSWESDDDAAESIGVDGASEQSSQPQPRSSGPRSLFGNEDPSQSQWQHGQLVANWASSVSIDSQDLDDIPQPRDEALSPRRGEEGQRSVDAAMADSDEPGSPIQSLADQRRMPSPSPIIAPNVIRSLEASQSSPDPLALSQAPRLRRVANPLSAGRPAVLTAAQRAPRRLGGVRQNAARDDYLSSPDPLALDAYDGPRVSANNARVSLKRARDDGRQDGSERQDGPSRGKRQDRGDRDDRRRDSRDSSADLL